MANTNNPKSFVPISISLDCYKREFEASASLASEDGDILYFDADGRMTDNPATTGRIAGLQVSAIINQTTGDVRSGTTVVGDKVTVNCDPDLLFKGQSSVFALADPVTTAVSTTCFDVAGAAGVQYVDAGSSTYDIIRVVGLSSEDNTGKQSAIGAYAKCIFGFNPFKHFMRSSS